jgi:hypothetical protein
MKYDIVNSSQTFLKCIRVFVTNLYIEPPELCMYSTYDFSKAEQLFKTGYEYAKIKLDEFLVK